MVMFVHFTKYSHIRRNQPGGGPGQVQTPIATNFVHDQGVVAPLMHHLLSPHTQMRVDIYEGESRPAGHIVRKGRQPAPTPPVCQLIWAACRHVLLSGVKHSTVPRLA